MLPGGRTQRKMKHSKDTSGLSRDSFPCSGTASLCSSPPFLSAALSAAGSSLPSPFPGRSPALPAARLAGLHPIAPPPASLALLVAGELDRRRDVSPGSRLGTPEGDPAFRCCAATVLARPASLSRPRPVPVTPARFLFAGEGDRLTPLLSPPPPARSPAYGGRFLGTFAGDLLFSPCLTSRDSLLVTSASRLSVAVVAVVAVDKLSVTLYISEYSDTTSAACSSLLIRILVSGPSSWSLGGGGGGGGASGSWGFGGNGVSERTSLTVSSSSGGGGGGGGFLVPAF